MGARFEQAYYERKQLTAALSIAEEALAIARRHFGRDRRLALSLKACALVLNDQGQFARAETLYREETKILGEVLGPRHPDTLFDSNLLAKVVTDQGRYGEAEQLQREVVKGMREVLGPRDGRTLLALNNLATLLMVQQRSAEAEPLLREALRGRREVFGRNSAEARNTMFNLAALLHEQGRYADAEQLQRELLQAAREADGPDHRDTLTIMANLGSFLSSQHRYAEAEALLREASQTARETVNSRDPLATVILSGLGNVLHYQHRDAEAEPLLREALALARKSPAQGPRHPATKLIHLSLVNTLVMLDRRDEAAGLLQELEPQIMARLATGLQAIEAPGARQFLVSAQSSYQDFALSLALLPGASQQATELAASAVLRFKSLVSEEEAALAAAARRNGDARVRALAAEVAGLRARLAAQMRGAGSALPGGGEPGAGSLAQQLDAKEQELGRASRPFSQALQVRAATLKGLRRAVAERPVRSALLEIREFHPRDFQDRSQAEPRWAGVLVTPDNEVRVHDLGPVSGGARAVQALLHGGPEADGAASALYTQLITPFAAELAGVERLYFAPDGVLYLTNPAMLRGPDNRRLLEAMDLRLVQTGRDLLRPLPERPARGLAALGGITFDAVPERRQPAQGDRGVAPVDGDAARRQAADALGGFTPLPGTAAEVDEIARLYRQGRPDEPVQVLRGAEASKARLLALAAPRVLHLATHGFYLVPKAPSDRPMLLAGVALAGANAELHGNRRDGILYAIEAQGMDLEGTELVVLSACDTAQGQIDYGDGLSGLVRALRTAGARRVLVSLREVSDAAAAAFMRRFYRHLLAQGNQPDPAAALRAAQREYLDAAGDAARAAEGSMPGGADDTWTRFILIGG